MKLWLLPQAQLRIDAAREWWLEHRDKAPALFDEELAAALARIRDVPTIGQRVRLATGEPVRRVLLPKTAHHLYYDVEGDEVVVLTLWGAPRGDERRFG